MNILGHVLAPRTLFGAGHGAAIHAIACKVDQNILFSGGEDRYVLMYVRMYIYIYKSARGIQPMMSSMQVF